MEGYPRRWCVLARGGPVRRDAQGGAGLRLTPSLLAASILLSLLLTHQAAAATTDVPAGSNLNLLTPANGDIWNLLGNAYLSNGTSASFAKTLPSGTPGLTINGLVGGSVVTLNDGAGHYAYFKGAATTLNLSNISVTGGVVPAGVNGAVINATGAVVINTTGTVSFINNTAGRNGGVIYATQPVTINGSVIANNNSALNGSGGGVIYLTSGAITINGSVSMDSNFAGGPSNTSPGGALYAPGGILLAPTSGDVSLTNNLSNTSGGAASAGSGLIAVGNSAANVTLMGNRAGFNTDGTQHSVGFGGVLRAGLITLTGRSITLSDNTATGNGGALYGNNAVAVSGDLVANGNVALVGAGGAIYALSGDVTTNGDISMAGNKAGSGGGGAIIAINGNVNVSTSSGNVTLTSNTASSHGGAINSSADVVVGNSSGTVTITGNSAGLNLDGSQANSASFGGGIYSAKSVTINGDVTASGNTATAAGGVIYAATGNVTVNGTLTASGNTAGSAGSGGAMWAGGEVTLGNAASVLTVQSNNAGGNGGAIYAGSGVSLSASGTSTISGNMAGGQGGALWSGGGASIMSTSGDLSFAGNTAGGLGGAIYLDPTTLTLSATGGDITFSGNTQNTSGMAQANAIYIANVNSGTLVTFDANAGHSITFYDPIQNNGSNGLVTVTKTGDGLVSFDGSNYTNETDRWSQMYANTEVQAGTFEIANNAAYGSRAADVGGVGPSTFTVDTGATLQGGGFGSLLADQVTFANGATLNLAGRQPGVRAVFGIDAANVNFTPGSVIVFNTELNDATVQNSDRLVLSRAATSGTGTILVNNINGTGGVTVGDGIQLVATINGATTNADSFVLGERVAAGAYEYALVRGSPTNGDDWFLRDTYTPAPPGPPSPPAPPGPPDPPVPPAPPYPPAPAPTPTPAAPVLPDYRVEVPVDSAVPALANQMGLAMLSNYHDRVGEDYAQLGGDTGLGPSSGWGRIFGTSGSVGYGGGTVDDHFNHFMSNGPSYDFSQYGFQTGLDLYRTDDDGERNIAGVSLGANRINSDIRNIYDGTKAGSVSMDGYTFGGYWTRKGASGWYIDGVMQLSRYESIHAPSVEGQELDSAGWGFDASLEGGYPFVLGDQWRLEPQGQVIYQRISLNDGHDDYGQISYNGSDALYGRLGMRLLHDLKLGSGYPLTAWARLNVWGSMGPDPKTTFSGLDGLDAIAFKTTLGSAWWQAQLGISGQVATRISLFGSLDYDRPLSSANGHSVGGRVGVRLVW